MKLSWALAALSAAVTAVRAGHIELAKLSKRFDSVVVVGDSLSDNGNVYRLTNQTWPADKAYHRGRFSNGPVWVEYLAREHRLFKRHADLLDLAYGGATTNNSRTQGFTGYNSSIPVPSVLDQVSTYLSRARKEDLSRKLFIVTGGANDAFFGLGGPIPPAKLAKLAAADLLTAASRLYKAGGRHFLIPGVPGLQTTPFATSIATAYAPTLSAYSEAFFAYLSKHYKRRVGKAAVVILFDQQRVLAEFIEDKSKKPRWNVRDACLQGVYPNEAPTRSLCDDPQRHVFWDIFHPTTRTHRFVAEAALKTITDALAGRAA